MNEGGHFHFDSYGKAYLAEGYPMGGCPICAAIKKPVYIVGSAKQPKLRQGARKAELRRRGMR